MASCGDQVCKGSAPCDCEDIDVGQSSLYCGVSSSSQHGNRWRVLDLSECSASGTEIVWIRWHQLASRRVRLCNEGAQSCNEGCGVAKG